MKLSELQRAWMESPKWLDLAENTRRVYHQSLRSLIAALGDVDLTTVDLSLFNLSLTTYGNHTSRFLGTAALRSMLKWTEHSGLLPNGFHKTVWFYPQQRDPLAWKPWTKEEVRTVVRNERTEAGRTLAMAVAIMYFTGQRVSDVVALDWSTMVHEDNRAWFKLKQKKTGTFMYSPVHPQLWEVIGPYKDDSGPVLRYRGKAVDYKQLNRMWQAVRIDLKLGNLRLHDVRKSAGTHIIDEGGSGYQAMAVTGHKSKRVFEDYIKYRDQKKLALQGTEKLHL